MKKLDWTTICSAIALSLLANLLFGRFLAAKISTLPLINRWKIMSPLTPIVINTKEEIRISDGGDVLNAIEQAKSKISAVVSGEGGQAEVLGGAINLTSEGIFATAGNIFASNSAGYFVILNDGRTAQITRRVADPATGLVFFRAELGNVPVAGLGDSKALNAGEKILLLSNSAQTFQTKYLSSFISSVQSDIQRQIFDSDHPSRSFGVQAAAPILNGASAVNLKGEIVGLWDGSRIISSDILRAAFNLYLSNQAQIKRPAFGFIYSVLTKNESKLLALPEGALVKTAAKQAAAAGLLPKDIITAVGGEQVNENQPLEELLQKYRPGDKLNMEVYRGKEKINLPLTAGELK